LRRGTPSVTFFAETPCATNSASENRNENRKKTDSEMESIERHLRGGLSDRLRRNAADHLPRMRHSLFEPDRMKIKAGKRRKIQGKKDLLSISPISQRKASALSL
jgi:hypothetical protein